MNILNDVPFYYEFTDNKDTKNGIWQKDEPDNDPSIQWIINLQHIGEKYYYETTNWSNADQTKTALKKHGYLLQHVKNQTPELCIEAIQSCPFAIRFVNKKTEELCLLAVKLNGLALKYVENQTKEICEAAIKNNKKALYYVRDIRIMI
jgi:hypothetical protein